MSLLFAEPLIAGLQYCDDVITADEEAELVGCLGRLDLAPFKFHGWLGNRKTHSFGWRYDFDDASFMPADPLPEWLLPLRAKAADFARVAPRDFIHALIARYDPGAGIGWHRDRPVFDTVVGVSLASPAKLRFRRRSETGFERTTVNVEPRSAYLLAGAVRHQWEHSIAPGDQLRFSITFRTLSDLGRRKAEAQRIS
jgi:alkylated DNA repair protein (DNA oxidative demethylase)